MTIKPLSVKLLLQLTRPSNGTKYYRVRLVNLDLKDLPPRSMDIRNDSSIVQVPIPIDYLGAVYEVRVSTFMCDLTSDPVTVVVSSRKHLHPPSKLIRIFNFFPQLKVVGSFGLKFLHIEI